MRGLVQAWAKNSVVTGAVRYPLSPVVSSPEPSLHRVCRRSFPPSDRAIAGHFVVLQSFLSIPSFPAGFLCAWCARPSNNLCPFSSRAPVASRP